MASKKHIRRELENTGSYSGEFARIKEYPENSGNFWVTCKDTRPFFHDDMPYDNIDEAIDAFQRYEDEYFCTIMDIIRK